MNMQPTLPGDQAFDADDIYASQIRDQTSTARRTSRAIKSIDPRSMFAYGALLAGVVALIRFTVAAIVIGIHGTRTDVFTTWAQGLGYVSASVFIVVFLAILEAVLGGLIALVLALIYNLVARAMGGIRIELGD